MYQDKTFLGIIPARSGSKGLPDKNIRPFAGKPLLAHTIETAKASGILDNIFVSTDSQVYAAIAKEYGAPVPFLRPDRLSGDQALTSECIIHAIESFREIRQTFDYFVLLQPTSPLRKPEHILEGVKMAVEGGLDAVVAFSPAEHPLSYYHALPANLSLEALAEKKELPRQDEPVYYRINGMLYICRCDKYMRDVHFYGPNSKAYVIDKKYAIDIDDENDFLMAEFLYEKGRQIIE